MTDETLLKARCDRVNNFRNISERFKTFFTLAAAEGQLIHDHQSIFRLRKFREPAARAAGSRFPAGRPGKTVAVNQTAAGAVRASALTTGVIGAAVMAAVDEIVFHQLLGWHHFYDRSTLSVGLLTDGLLHAAELIALVGGFFYFADLRRRGVLHRTAGWGGFLLGAGLFQLYDGLVDHKILRLHQIRYGVHLLPYDVAWNVAGALLALAGAAVLWRARTRARPDR